MIAIIPVKLSERLPGKHLLKIGDKTIIEQVYHKVSSVFDTHVYSKVPLPVPYVKDNSENIMDLVYSLRLKYGTFALIGGDMAFFTEADLKVLLDGYKSGPVVPSDGKGDYEPMFSIYAGTPSRTSNLRGALITENTVFLPRSLFSRHAFFNINTRKDYEEALKIFEKLGN